MLYISKWRTVDNIIATKIALLFGKLCFNLDFGNFFGARGAQLDFI